MSEYGALAVRASVRTQPNSFKITDFEQKKVTDAAAKPSKPHQSVFVPNTEWASPSTCAVLDNLHSQNAAEASNSEQGKAELSYMRCAGSTMQDGNDADLFESENVRGMGPRSAFRNFLLECKHCRRSMLGTRFVNHLKLCAKHPKANSPASDAVDAEINLVESPYIAKQLNSCKYKSSDNPPSGDNAAVSFVSLPYFETSSSEIGALRKRGFQWRKRISPLGPVRKARGGRLSSYGKVALVPFKVTPTPKKKQSTPERRAIAGANSVGLGSMEKEDELSFAGGSWGASAQWSKLIQCCRPIVVPRSELRKNTLTRETPLSLFAKIPNTNQFVLAETVYSKMQARNPNTRVTKALSRNLPSLPGAILHVRGKYSKSLQGTDLAKLDISSTSIPKAIYMYHGQSFFANPGQFFSDHRSPAEVKLPASVVDSGLPVRGSNQFNPQQNPALIQQQQPRAAPAPSTPATPQEPPTKRQRTTKGRTNNTPSSGIPPKQPLPVQRKIPQARPAQTALNQKRNALIQQQQMAQRLQHAANNPASAVPKRAQPRPNAGNMHSASPGNFAIPPSAINPHQIAAVTKPPGANGAPRGNPMMHSNVAGQHGNVQAQKMMQHNQNAMLNVFQPSGLKGQVAPNVPMRANPGGMGNPELEAILRGVGASAGMTQPGMNYNAQELAAAMVTARVAQNQTGARSMAVGGNQHQRNINLRAQNQAQSQVQAAVNPAVQARMTQIRNMQQRGAPAAALRQQQFNASQKRPSNVQTSSALSGRSGGSTAAPIFAGQQMGNNMGLFNQGFSVAVPPTHERNGSNKTASIPPNPTSLAYMALMQNTSNAGALSAQLANVNTASPAAIAAGLKGMPAAMQQFGQGGGAQGNMMQQVGQGVGAQGNMMNFFPGQDTPAAGMTQQQRLAMQNVARLSGRPVPGMLPAETIMSTLMPNSHPMQGTKSNTPIITTPSSGNNNNNQHQTAVALDEIDKALSLGSLG